MYVCVYGSDLIFITFVRKGEADEDEGEAEAAAVVSLIDDDKYYTQQKIYIRSFSHFIHNTFPIHIYVKCQRPLPPAPKPAANTTTTNTSPPSPPAIISSHICVYNLIHYTVAIEIDTEIHHSFACAIKMRDTLYTSDFQQGGIGRNIVI